jgi:fumarate hydratase subunit alpha
MKIIQANKITRVIAELCIQANQILRKDVFLALKVAYKKETNKRAKDILEAIIKNAKIAADEKLAICQDTGLVCVFVEIGQDVKINGDLKSAINKGVELGYKKGSLRNSIVKDPLQRGPSKFSPAVIHSEIVKGNKVKITVLPKGFGCENKSQLKMFNPTAKIIEIKKFIVDAVKSAGPDACPPYIVGVGIGGTADYACFLAKKALLRKITNYELRITNYEKKLEQELLSEINRLNIGPMGLGGKTTALAVNIETYPTHIAGLPVAINISCHALRSATKII